MTRAQRISEWEKTDSISRKRVLCMRYLTDRIAELETVIGTDFPDDIVLEDLVAELREDMIMALEQIKLGEGYPRKEDFR